MTDPELEELRKRKLMEYQQETARQQQMQAQIQLRAILRKVLEPEAFERIERVKLASPELYAQAVRYVIALHQAGRLPKKLNDDEVKALLLRLRGPKRETKIRIAHKG